MKGSVRVQGARAWTCGPLDAASVVAVAREQGERLSLSRKTEVVRVGEWVVKRSRFDRGLGPLRLSAGRRRYRGAFEAGRRLFASGVGVPEVAGYVEWSFAGVITRNAMVMRYLEGFIPIRTYAIGIRDEPDSEIDFFLAGLVRAVKSLEAADAYHSDLASKNVLTREGREFRFVDLDALRFGNQPARDERIRNAAQLMDAFRLIWPEERLRWLAGELKPGNESMDSWIRDVMRALAERVSARRALYSAAGRVAPEDEMEPRSR